MPDVRPAALTDPRAASEALASGPLPHSVRELVDGLADRFGGFAFSPLAPAASQPAARGAAAAPRPPTPTPTPTPQAESSHPAAAAAMPVVMSRAIFPVWLASTPHLGRFAVAHFARYCHDRGKTLQRAYQFVGGQLAAAQASPEIQRIGRFVRQLHPCERVGLLQIASWLLDSGKNLLDEMDGGEELASIQERAALIGQTFVKQWSRFCAPWAEDVARQAVISLIFDWNLAVGQVYCSAIEDAWIRRTLRAGAARIDELSIQRAKQHLAVLLHRALATENPATLDADLPTLVDEAIQAMGWIRVAVQASTDRGELTSLVEHQMRAMVALRRSCQEGGTPAASRRRRNTVSETARRTLQVIQDTEGCLYTTMWTCRFDQEAEASQTMARFMTSGIYDAETVVSLAQTCRDLTGPSPETAQLHPWKQQILGELGRFIREQATDLEARLAALEQTLRLADDEANFPAHLAQQLRGDRSYLPLARACCGHLQTLVGCQVQLVRLDPSFATTLVPALLKGQSTDLTEADDDALLQCAAPENGPLAPVLRHTLDHLLRTLQDLLAELNAREFKMPTLKRQLRAQLALTQRSQDELAAAADAQALAKLAGTVRQLLRFHWKSMRQHVGADRPTRQVGASHLQLLPGMALCWAELVLHARTDGTTTAAHDLTAAHAHYERLRTQGGHQRQQKAARQAFVAAADHYADTPTMQAALRAVQGARAERQQRSLETLHAALLDCALGLLLAPEGTAAYFDPEALATRLRALVRAPQSRHPEWSALQRAWGDVPKATRPSVGDAALRKLNAAFYRGVIRRTKPLRQRGLDPQSEVHFLLRVQACLQELLPVAEAAHQAERVEGWGAYARAQRQIPVAFCMPAELLAKLQALRDALVDKEDQLVGSEPVSKERKKWTARLERLQADVAAARTDLAEQPRTQEEILRVLDKVPQLQAWERQCGDLMVDLQASHTAQTRAGGAPTAAAPSLVGPQPKCADLSLEHYECGISLEPMTDPVEMPCDAKCLFQRCEIAAVCQGGRQACPICTTPFDLSGTGLSLDAFIRRAPKVDLKERYGLSYKEFLQHRLTQGQLLPPPAVARPPSPEEPASPSLAVEPSRTSLGQRRRQAQLQDLNRATEGQRWSANPYEHL